MGLPNDVSTWLEVASLPFPNIRQLEESIARVNVVCFSLAVNEYVFPYLLIDNAVKDNIEKETASNRPLCLDFM